MSTSVKPFKKYQTSNLIAKLITIKTLKKTCITKKPALIEKFCLPCKYRAYTYKLTNKTDLV
jgi:hypothetical protein